MKAYYIHGHKVELINNLADFTEFGVLLRCDSAHFTYDWVLKAHYKLSVLKGRVA